MMGCPYVAHELFGDDCNALFVTFLCKVGGKK
jgi:hypothetical protein